MDVSVRDANLGGVKVRSGPLVPPVPKVHPRPLGGSPLGDLRIAWEMSRNLIGAWC